MEMNYYVYRQIVQTTKRCDLETVYQIAEQCVAQKELWYTEAVLEENPLMHFRELFKIVTEETVEIDGNADDYHNLATLYAKNNFYDFACGILDRGLKAYSDSTDLLADYLQYGMSCRRFEECSLYYKRLKAITKDRWTWRAYVFSIDYMLTSLQQKHGEFTFDEVYSVAKEFSEQPFTDEEALFTLSRVFHEFGKFNDEVSILNEALDKYVVAPKSALRLSDIYFERGEYKKAIPLLNRAIANAVRPQLPINISYCYLLLAMCKIAPLLNEDKQSVDRIPVDREGIEKRTVEIFEHAHTASQMGGLNDTLLLNLRQMTKLLELRFGVKNPYWDE